MERNTIKPDRITKPFQLLAAWLVGLIVVNASFLGAASLISLPSWGPNALIIASIANVPLFIGSIFLLQTKFRPEMQTDDYYSDYRKRELELRQTELQFQKEIKEQVKQDVEIQIQEVVNIDNLEEQKVAINKMVDSFEELNLMTKYYNSSSLRSFYKFRYKNGIVEYTYPGDILHLSFNKEPFIITKMELDSLRTDGLVNLAAVIRNNPSYSISDLGIKIYERIKNVFDKNELNLDVSEQRNVSD
ncbi:hypothetical protein LDB17_14595 [Dysgonomonas sp. Shenzhen-Wh21]|uniref:hypothetical protein n=1 Tax=Dysgonomonas TaxID=156973 RepID=UPI00208DFDD3|nr:hypothetical protein [Dysgonomonas mossii]